MNLHHTQLVAALAAGLLLAGCVDDTTDEPGDARAATPAPNQAPPNASPTPAPAGGQNSQFVRPVGMDCLVNEYGIRRKAIVVRPNVQCSERPGEQPAGLPLRYFFPYYIHEVTPSSGTVTHLRLGSTPRRDSVLGWVPAADCAIWDHRIAIRRSRVPDVRTPPLLIYEHKAECLELLRTGRTGAEPIARASLSGAERRTWMPWPVIEVARVEEGGMMHELYRLAFLGETRGDRQATPAARISSGTSAANPYSPDEIARIQSAVKMLDVCFVIDVTGSMQPFFEAVKHTVAQLADQLSRLDIRPSVALSLVPYRDYDKASEFVTKHFDLTEDRAAFLGIMNSIQAGQGGDAVEAVYDGVLDGLERTSWRGKGLSARVMVLLGDCPAHEHGDPQNPRSITPEALVGHARQSHVKIFALAVGGQSGNALYDLRWKQFSRLAGDTGGACVTIENSDAVVKQIRDIVATEVAVVHDRSTIVDQWVAGKSRGQIVAQNGVDVHAFTEVMEFLARAGVDPEKLRGQPVFSTGWCLATAGNVPLVTKEVLVARSELELLTSELNGLCTGLEADFGHNVAKLGFAGRVDPRSWFNQADKGPLDIWLAKQGIPTSTGLLKLTRTDMDHMTEEQRARLRETVLRHYVPRLVNLRNDDSVFLTVDDLEWGFVPEDSLP